MPGTCPPVTSPAAQPRFVVFVLTTWGCAVPWCLIPSRLRPPAFQHQPFTRHRVGVLSDPRKAWSWKPTFQTQILFTSFRETRAVSLHHAPCELGMSAPFHRWVN